MRWTTSSLSRRMRLTGLLALLVIAGLSSGQSIFDGLVPQTIAPAPKQDQAVTVSAPTTVTKPPVTDVAARHLTIDVAGSDIWVDTKLDLYAQDDVTITATGNLMLANGQAVPPGGVKRGFRDMLRSYPVNDAGQAALIGRINDNAAAQGFLVGASLKVKASVSGRLFLGINRGGEVPDGTFHVTVDVAARTADSLKPAEFRLPQITQELIDRYPRRIVDDKGNAGDNTNFLIVGTEKQVLNALKVAGWVEVDHGKEDAVMAGFQAVLDRRAYLTLPMSELTFFGRVQDHGLAHAEPLAVVAQRHHFRIWKAPFQATVPAIAIAGIPGSPAQSFDLWVGAGTHDIGFDRDKRNNGITHKIDPDIDLERDYIGMTLMESGLAAKIGYITPSKPSKEAITATGASFHSDGRVLVIYLVPDASSASAAPEASGKNPGTNKSPSIFDGLH